MLMIVSLLLGLPRLVLAGLWYFTDPRWTNVIHSRWLKVVGFIVLPYTTLAYVLVHRWKGEVDLGRKQHLAILGVALIVDLGAWFSGKRLLRRKKD